MSNVFDAVETNTRETDQERILKEEMNDLERVTKAVAKTVTKTRWADMTEKEYSNTDITW